MRYLTIIFFLAVALATSARAQLINAFTVAIDLTSPVSGNLSFKIGRASCRERV